MRRAVVVVLLVPALARADAKSDSQVHVDRATQLHGDGKLAEASAELAIGYALDPRPELLFAIGQVQLRLGRCGLAVAFYKRFLAANPDNEAGARDAITSCKEPPVDAKAESAKRIQHATALHESGKYDDARGELSLAYALDPQPPVLYALGQLDVKLDHCEAAVPFYERFLSTKPAVGADEATEAVDVCKKKLAEAKPAPAPVAPAPVAPPPPQPAGRPWYGDKLTLGIGTAALGCAVAGTVLYLRARSALDDADAAPTYDRSKSLVDSAHTDRAIAAVVGGAAVALTGLAVYRYVKHGKAEHVAVAPAHGGGVVSWSASF